MAAAALAFGLAATGIAAAITLPLLAARQSRQASAAPRPPPSFRRRGRDRPGRGARGRRRRDHPQPGRRHRHRASPAVCRRTTARVHPARRHRRAEVWPRRPRRRGHPHHRLPRHRSAPRPGGRRPRPRRLRRGVLVAGAALLRHRTSPPDPARPRAWRPVPAHHRHAGPPIRRVAQETRRTRPRTAQITPSMFRVRKPRSRFHPSDQNQLPLCCWCQAAGRVFFEVAFCGVPPPWRRAVWWSGSGSGLSEE